MKTLFILILSLLAISNARSQEWEEDDRADTICDEFDRISVITNLEVAERKNFKYYDDGTMEIISHRFDKGDEKFLYISKFYLNGNPMVKYFVLIASQKNPPKLINHGP